MSVAKKTRVARGTRYAAGKKQEIFDFAINHNTANGRGGVSQAAKKPRVSRVTVAASLKQFAPVGKSSKANENTKLDLKYSKPVKNPRGRKSWFTGTQKQEVVAFVVNYNGSHGRGGVGAASRQFGISYPTVVAWLGANGSVSQLETSRMELAVPEAHASRSSRSVKLKSLLALCIEIEKAEEELSQLRTNFELIKATL